MNMVTPSLISADLFAMQNKGKLLWYLISAMLGNLSQVEILNDQVMLWRLWSLDRAMSTVIKKIYYKEIFEEYIGHISRNKIFT